MAHWLLKSEPDEFGYDDLVAKGREGWDGVRNYTARIHLRAMRKDDTAIFYHSPEQKAASPFFPNREARTWMPVV